MEFSKRFCDFCGEEMPQNKKPCGLIIKGRSVMGEYDICDDCVDGLADKIARTKDKLTKKVCTGEL